jgi:hypothetical protein
MGGIPTRHIEGPTLMMAGLFNFKEKFYFLSLDDFKLQDEKI